jgi:serine/threonine-protein kinase
MTRIGMILGTAAYMSPEQARGGLVEKRADVWAFGVILYEMLSGRRLFDEPTVSETLAAVLKVDGLPRETPAAVTRLIGRCLTRDWRRRLRDIGEARITIEDVLMHPDTAGARDTPSEAEGLSPRSHNGGSVNRPG